MCIGEVEPTPVETVMRYDLRIGRASVATHRPLGARVRHACVRAEVE